MKKIIVLGGGTAGLISSLIIKKTFDAEVTIIKSKEIGIIGVGEGSTEHWLNFITYCGIDWRELIKETDATCKAGIYFSNGWSSQNFFHNVNFRTSQLKIGQMNYSYLSALASDQKQAVVSSFFNLENLVKNINEPSTNQFHFNTFKLNQYLLKKCKENGVKVIDDTIKDVEINDQGIDTLIGSKTYKADFYIDCTGFARVLISKLGAQWISYSKHFPMNEAIAFPTGDTDEYTPFTESRKTPHGWTWRIPTYGRWGNGHVFNNNYKTATQAKEESEAILGHEIEVAKNIKFDPGALDKVWVKNCLAVGLCANFVEPLEATSIGTTIQQIFLFNHYFINDTQFSRDSYNKKVNQIMDNIKDFVLIHYLNENIDLPETLQDKLNLWKKRPPINEDFNETHFYLFYSDNFFQVLYGMDFWNKDEMNELINKYNKTSIALMASKFHQDLKVYAESRNSRVSHKKWIEAVRNGQ